jgi:hypothetical protein
MHQINKNLKFSTGSTKKNIAKKNRTKSEKPESFDLFFVFSVFVSWV